MCKLKSFCTAKQSQQNEDNLQNGKKLFVSHITEKRLTTKIYEEFIQFNSKKNQTIQFKNGQRS